MRFYFHADPIVRSHAPTVNRVGFFDVDCVEVDFVTEATVDLVEDSRLESEGASGEAPKDQHDRLLRCGQSDSFFGQLELVVLFVLGQ